MNFKPCQDWVQTHRDSFFDFIRMYLGVGLLVKGVFFLMHPDQLAVPDGNALMASVAQAVPYVHIVGGLLLALGLFTRLAALVQIPLLLGAALLVHLPGMSEMKSREGFEFSMLVMFLLVLVFFRGAGEFSLSHYWKRSPGEPNAYQQWVDTHADVFMDLMRVFLGVGLFIKGLYILGHRDQYQALFDQSNTTMIVALLALHYVIPAHLVGGASLALGLVTRASALVQLPLLFGAVFYLYLPHFTVMEQRQSFEFTSLVLFLLLLLTAHGSGRFSLDHAIETSAKPRLHPEPAH